MFSRVAEPRAETPYDEHGTGRVVDSLDEDEGIKPLPESETMVKAPRSSLNVMPPTVTVSACAQESDKQEA